MIILYDTMLIARVISSTNGYTIQIMNTSVRSQYDGNSLAVMREEFEVGVVKYSTHSDYTCIIAFVLDK